MEEQQMYETIYNKYRRETEGDVQHRRTQCKGHTARLSRWQLKSAFALTLMLTFTLAVTLVVTFPTCGPTLVVHLSYIRV